jgi:hypothetical protein
MFVIAPAICAIIGVFISPFACRIFVQMLSRKSPKEKTHTIRPYVTTSLITSAESVDIFAYAGMKK